MRRNFASLDLTALSESASAGDDDAGPDLDLASMDPDAAALYADVLGLDADAQHAAAAVAHLCLDDDAGCPLEMMADKQAATATTTAPVPRVTSPPSAVPTAKQAALPAIRASANDPVRRSHVEFADAPSAGSSPLAASPFAAKTTAATAHKPLLLHSVPLHRNVIQSV